ncbi:MAG TPA: GntR family transcriptional regulator [Paenibacillaceae bacterium]
MNMMQSSKRSSKIKRSVLREEIKAYLTDKIMRGEYKPNERLVETQIARELGVSQAPVREAFRDLELMGLLTTMPYKGAYVREFTVEDVKNCYDVRAELEGLAIRSATEYMTDSDIKRLEELYQQMLDAAKEGNLQKEISLDIEFHRTIVEASRNNILQKIWNEISIANWTYFGGYKNKSDRLNLVKRHEPILEALRQRDAQKCSELMRKHFIELKEMVEE